MKRKENAMKGKMWANANGRRLAFSLVELLIVLGVIAALAAILFPILLMARERGRQAACSSNLHQLALAVTQYAQDNNGFPPPYNTYLWPNPPQVFLDQSAQMVASLKPFTGTTDLWFCPSDPYAHIGGSPLPFYRGYVNHRNTSYVCVYEYRINQPLHLINLLSNNFSTSETDLFIENASGCWANEDSKDQSLYSHNGMFNAVMLDGHVRSYHWNDPNCLQMLTP